MTTTTKSLVIVAEAKLATPAAAAFERAAGLFLSHFSLQVLSPTQCSVATLEAAERVMAWGTELPSEYLHCKILSIKLNDDLEQYLRQVIAEVMGGGAAFVPPPPPKHPPKPKSLGTVKLSRETAGRRG